MKPKILILRAPGTNCDQETGYAFQLAGGDVGYLHINQLVENPRVLANYQVLCFPGGFSFGDDIAAGRILASQLQGRLADVIAEFRDAGKLILGICNGFQILIKSGFLLHADQTGLPATLTWNDSGRFISTWVDLQVQGNRCVFLQGIDRLYLPIAHAEGKFMVRDQAALDRLQDQGQLALRYADPEIVALGEGSIGHEAQQVGKGGTAAVLTPPTLIGGSVCQGNPNGSTADVAGVCDETGRVFGLMPHPERHVDPTHHPHWTRRQHQPSSGEGLAIFQNAIRFFS